jgi:site-specific recombinase XerD
MHRLDQRLVHTARQLAFSKLSEGAREGRLARYVAVRSHPGQRPKAAKTASRRLSPDAPLFPNRDGAPMTRSNVHQRLEVAIRIAAEKHPQFLNRGISPHTFRHITAMHLLQSGVDITVIALWLGHESRPPHTCTSKPI